MEITLRTSEFIDSSQVRVHKALAGLYEKMGDLKRSREEAELAKLLMTGKIKFTSAEIGDSNGDWLIIYRRE